MKYSIMVNEVRAKEGSNIKGFATVVFGDSFKITNIAILENKDKGELFVSMPRYRSNERDESNGVIYKDVCNPITAEFREEQSFERNSIPISLMPMQELRNRRKRRHRSRSVHRKCRSFP